MISASKTTFSHLKILRPKVTKNIKNLRKKFCEFWHGVFSCCLSFETSDRKICYIGHLKSGDKTCIRTYAGVNFINIQNIGEKVSRKMLVKLTTVWGQVSQNRCSPVLLNWWAAWLFFILLTNHNFRQKFQETKQNGVTKWPRNTYLDLIVNHGVVVVVNVVVSDDFPSRPHQTMFLSLSFSLS